MNESFHTSSHLSCSEHELLLADYAADALAPAEAQRLTDHLRTCPACQQQLAELRLLLTDLAALPAPAAPTAMRDDFMALLAREKAAVAAELPRMTVAPALPAREPKVIPLWQTAAAGWFMRAAASVLLVAVGTVLGLVLYPLVRGGELAATSAPTAVGRPALAVALDAAAEQPATASSRIKLVTEAPETAQPGDPAVQVLINTLNFDPNPNVRLAACEALFHLRADPRVGPALVKSLPIQTDPNVQITLIELLVALREKRAVPQLEKLARQPGALKAVRQQAEQGVGLLI